MRRKVLVIAYYWPPAGGGGVQRWVKFVKYLREYGWEPIVYTAENADYPILDPSLNKEIPDGIEVIRRPILEPYNLFRKLKGMKKTDRMDPSFLSQGKKMGLKEKIAVWIRGNFFIPDARCLWISPSVRYLVHYLKVNPVDAIVSTGPPHSCHMIGLALKQKLQVPWIADFRDQWTQIDYFEDLHLSRRAIGKHKSMEKSVLDNCDTIVTVGPHLAHGLKMLTGNHIEVITNGFDEQDRNQQVGFRDSRFSLVYIGTINDAQNPHVIWKVLSDLKKGGHPMMKNFVMKVVGKVESQVLDNVRDFDLEDIVEYKGYVSHNEAVAYQNSASVLLLLINNTRNNKAIVTGKLFEYLASGHPILCIGPQDGDAADIIRNTNSGQTFDYTDSIGVIRQLEAWYSAFLRGDLTTETRNIESYSRKNLTARMAAVLDEVVQKLVF